MIDTSSGYDIYYTYTTTNNDAVTMYDIKNKKIEA